MDFTQNYTTAIWTVGNHRANPTGFDLAKCSLLGNTLHAGVTAWLVSSRLYIWKIWARPVTMTEVAGVGTPIALKGKEEQSELGKTVLKPSVDLVRRYFPRLSHQGGDVAWSTSRAPGESVVPRGLDPREWRWKNVVSTKWQLTEDHINVLEFQALVLGGLPTMTLSFVCPHLKPAERPSRQEEKTTNAAADDGQPTK